MPHRDTREAVAEAAPLELAREAAGEAARPEPDGTGSADPIAGDLRRAGVLPLLVLELLAEERSYGNRLTEAIAELSGGLLVVNPNTMYPLLRGLERDGRIEGAWEHPERRSRRFYAITPAGEAERLRLRAEVGPRLDAVAASVERLRARIGGGGR